MENDEMQQAITAVRDWQDYLHGQIECALRATCGLLRSADPAAPHDLRMLATLHEWRAMSADNSSKTSTAQLAGFDAAQKQVHDALRRELPTAH